MTDSSNNVKHTGKVIWFNSETGIGFIEKDDGTGDIFVHWTNIDMDGFKTLKPEQLVEFEIGENHKGPQSVLVRVTAEPNPEQEV